ncbi:hypothetical protein NE664_09250 [Anaerotignum faecicola]|nr:hypothetical protein [Anaerotignum faecicola]
MAKTYRCANPSASDFNKALMPPTSVKTLMPHNKKFLQFKAHMRRHSGSYGKSMQCSTKTRKTFLA